MIATQYEILLPADYDMDIIRRRVHDHGAALDDRAGLGLKAYLVQEIADGSPVNAYAPFYLWRDPAAPAAFHWKGQGFSGIVRDFGRPVVRTWIGGGFTRGDAFSASPTWALRHTSTLPPAIDPAEASEALSRAAAATCDREGVHSHAWGIDPSSWQSVEFTLLTHGPDQTTEPDSVSYRVLHLSSPEIEDLR